MLSMLFALTRFEPITSGTWVCLNHWTRAFVSQNICLFVWFYVLPSYFCNLFKVKWHVIGCIKHDIVSYYVLWFITCISIEQKWCICFDKMYLNMGLLHFEVDFNIENIQKVINNPKHVMSVYPQLTHFLTAVMQFLETTQWLLESAQAVLVWFGYRSGLGVE